MPLLCWYHVRTAVNKNICELAACRNVDSMRNIMEGFSKIMYRRHDTDEPLQQFMDRIFNEYLDTFKERELRLAGYFTSVWGSCKRAYTLSCRAYDDTFQSCCPPADFCLMHVWVPVNAAFVARNCAHPACLLVFCVALQEPQSMPLLQINGCYVQESATTRQAAIQQAMLKRGIWC